jgi:competence protein ComEC
VALDAGRVVFRNAGDEPIDLTGYAIIANGIELYRFPTLVLGPGETVTLHVGTGTDTESDLYAGYDRSSPAMGEYTVTVEDDEGDVVVRRSET